MTEKSLTLTAGLVGRSGQRVHVTYGGGSACRSTRWNSRINRTVATGTSATGSYAEAFAALVASATAARLRPYLCCEVCARTLAAALPQTTATLPEPVAAPVSERRVEMLAQYERMVANCTRKAAEGDAEAAADLPGLTERRDRLAAECAR